MKLPDSINPRRFGLIAGVAVLFLALIAFRGIQQHRLNSKPLEAERIPVELTVPEVFLFTDEVSFVANLEPEEQAAVVAKLAGKTFLRVLVDIGTPVKAGQVLAILDDSLLRPQLAQVEATVEKARAALSQARTQRETARKDFDRYEQLYGENVISGQQFDHAKGQVEVAEAGEKLARKQLAEAASGLDQLGVLMGYHVVRAPISGVIAARYVDPGDTSSAEKPSFLINRQDRVKVKGAVPESAFVKLKIGQEGTVVLDALEGRAVKGKVHRLSPAIDPVTRTGQAELLLSADQGLKPGMYARVTLNVGSHEGLAVPREAVKSLAGTGEKRVFLAKEGKAMSRMIRTGAEERDRIEVVEGLQPGEKVILTQSVRIGEGSLVEVLKP
jgi:RND family efflux transporter MFP subunit